MFWFKKNHLLITWCDIPPRWVLSTAAYINILMNHDPSEVWKRRLWRPDVQQRKSETAGVPCSVILYLRAAARGGRSRRPITETQYRPRQQRWWKCKWKRDLVRRSESSVNGCVNSAPPSRWPWSNNNSYCHAWMMENRSTCLQTANTRGGEKYMKTSLRRGLLPLDSQWLSQIVGWEQKKKRCLCFWKWEMMMPHPKHALRCLLRRMYSSHLICIANLSNWLKTS